MALDYTALGKRISTFRSASGLTQEQFCEKLNVSRKHISQIEAAISRRIYTLYILLISFRRLLSVLKQPNFSSSAYMPHMQELFPQENRFDRHHSF